MNREELTWKFNLNKRLFIGMTAASGLGALETLFSVVKHNPSYVIPAAVTVGAVTLASWCGIDAVDYSSRRAILIATGRDAEPERPDAIAASASVPNHRHG